MFFPSPPRDYEADLVAAGARWLADLRPAIDAADPAGSVTPRSRALCAALGLLSELTCRALGGDPSGGVGLAGAALSLLTKIDDQVIDGPAFHGGEATPRDELRRRTRAFLAPTLASIRAARPANDEPRASLAASLGASLRALAGGREDRIEHLLATIAAGWEVQVEAVAVLTSHPAAVTRAEVSAVTRSISGAWLLMIAMVGTLPAGAARALTPAEEAAFFAWGSAIQRADALADLDKDLADGHLASYPGKLLWERAPSAYLDAARRGDHRAVYALARRHEVDRDCLPGPDELAALAAPLAALGEVPALLAWIHAYLAGRYLVHPLSSRRANAVVTFLNDGGPAPRAELPPQTPREASCSAP